MVGGDAILGGVAMARCQVAATEEALRFLQVAGPSLSNARGSAAYVVLPLRDHFAFQQLIILVRSLPRTLAGAMVPMPGW